MPKICAIRERDRYDGICSIGWTGKEAIEWLRGEGVERVLLAFSRGKDAIGAWLRLREAFEVIPIHYVLVPGLRFVEDSLEYYEQYFGTKIIRMMHPNFYRIFCEGGFMEPVQWHMVCNACIPKVRFEDTKRMVCEDLGMDHLSTWLCDGVRGVDTPLRWQHFQQHGCVSFRQRKCSPIWDWRLDKLLGIIAKNGIKLPVDYRLFGRSFDGLDFRYVMRIKRYFPDDYERIKQVFPLIDAECLRGERLGYGYEV